MALADYLPKDSVITESKRTEPLWKGPEVDGVTFSLLSRFLVCRERFRIHVVEGLRPADSFNHRMEFGNMWHVCEEAFASYKGPSLTSMSWVQTQLTNYIRELRQRYRLQQEQINHWCEVCKALFPVYVGHWSKHPDVKDRTPLLQEQVFDVPYKLPSGRTVRLRGKWDSVDLIGKGKGAGIYIQENKTKSQIDSVKIARQLSFDLQVMLYAVALQCASSSELARNGWTNEVYKRGITDVNLHDFPILGVRYNVIRRSAHKSVESMMKKVYEDRDSGRIGEWFARWKVEITPEDVMKFRRQTLNPVLEQLCGWWEYVTTGRNSLADLMPMSWRHPFGIYNVLDEGGSSDLDHYLATGSTVGLSRAETLFPELEGS